jgi:LDH2 family malate/lactate/ureidoglycolate dehydrogenase
MPAEEAYINAHTLVEADLTGIESHGTSRMPIYLKRIRSGAVRSQCLLTVAADHIATGVMDAGNSMGAYASYKVMQTVIARARTTGVAFFTLKNSNHYGTAAYFAKMALEHDMIGISATNSTARMAPWGGRDAYFGTNPFAVAVPAGKELPVVADMATSVVARGKIIIAAKKNQQIPPGWALNKNGENTTDPQEALAGTVLPFAGPKGSAIALLIDVLTGVLSGSAFGLKINDMYADFKQPTYTSHMFAAIDISKFSAVEQFKDNMDRMIREIKSSTPAENVAEIYLPGEIELRKKQQRLIEGIPFSEAVLHDLRNEGQLCKVPYTLE